MWVHQGITKNGDVSGLQCYSKHMGRGPAALLASDVATMGI